MHNTSMVVATECDRETGSERDGKVDLAAQMVSWFRYTFQGH